VESHDHPGPLGQQIAAAASDLPQLGHRGLDVERFPARVAPRRAGDSGAGDRVRVRIDQFTDPPMVKGNSGNLARATTTSCTFTFTDSFEDPDLGLLTFTGDGSVTGFVTPVR
jgi:hypothetical protein